MKTFTYKIATALFPPPILSYWPTVTEVAIGVMAVEGELSHQYPVTCYCCVTDGIGGAA